MLRVLKTHKARVRAAAASVNQERELTSLMSYYPALERLLAKFAEVIPDTSQLALVIKAGMGRIASHRRLVPVVDDCNRLRDFMDSFLAAASASVLYVARCCREGLRFSLTEPELCCADGRWERVVPNPTDGRRDVLWKLIGLDNCEEKTCPRKDHRSA